MAAPIGIRFARLLNNLYFKNRCKPLNYCTTTSTETKGDENRSIETDTHFGFQRMSKKKKEEKVFEVFKNVAETYDTMNDIMSGGIHRLWKDRFMSVLHPTPGTKLLDVAGGTGDIAFRFLDFAKYQSADDSLSEIDQQGEGKQRMEVPTSVFPSDNSSHVVVCDINQNMLKVGQTRAQENNYVQGMNYHRCDYIIIQISTVINSGISISASKTPGVTLDSIEKLYFCHSVMPKYCSSSYDLMEKFNWYILLVYLDLYMQLFINLFVVLQALDEAYRVLKPGGRFLCLEFSHVNNPVLRSVYDTYSFQAIPVFGEVIASDWKSYQYLVESIRQFPNQDEFQYMIEDAGFSLVKYENLTFGVAAIHSGFKL
ncbi:2-methoxy-6-polyprenyl-1,4-benzoquinol methylase, mitochondrial-like [Anneissia japonica]|uniref:2-methoxy-6-polyprenyl-1,4-benzoquinol methylase, mitochondrial-like n=1 Tax=Anneissia japonica TaxID=1529436 RepID=UPI0014257029|nr:2-methoxy-6-polyprenyl-1,4-benzoquinol methylase, mitochondrial-like [Anneissia japonica]